MTTNDHCANLFHIARHLSIDAPEDRLAQLQSQIDDELTNLTLFEGVIPTLEKLQSLRIPVAICSNSIF